MKLYRTYRNGGAYKILPDTPETKAPSRYYILVKQGVPLIEASILVIKVKLSHIQPYKWNSLYEETVKQNRKFLQAKLGRIYEQYPEYLI